MKLNDERLLIFVPFLGLAATFIIGLYAASLIDAEIYARSRTMDEVFALRQKIGVFIGIGQVSIVLSFFYALFYKNKVK